ncbi:hypothetical protein JCM19239_1325 [Vibrio variabilis]|uniref:Uncharacterized protein n=1 Tax=Vibrio variabilis TaxID=990271 RepID=A0ABQ0JNV4_9VIBR|nr:hypothetical protein JCM19239_1325 [Vibrio variabilis]
MAYRIMTYTNATKNGFLVIGGTRLLSHPYLKPRKTVLRI